MFNDFVQYKIQSALKRTRINFYQRERERYAGQAGGAVSPWFQLDCGGCVAQAPKVPKKSDMLRNIRKTRSESLALIRKAISWAVELIFSITFHYSAQIVRYGTNSYKDSGTMALVDYLPIIHH